MHEVQQQTTPKSSSEQFKNKEISSKSVINITKGISNRMIKELTKRSW